MATRPEQPILEVHFRDAEGRIHTATLSSTWVPGAALDDVAFGEAAQRSMALLLESQDCTVLRTERVSTTYTEIA